jgi:2'-5' RNA ligase
MRAFIAVDIPPSVKQQLAALQDRLRASLPPPSNRALHIRWVLPEGIHLTLKFLGEITTTQAEQVKVALRALPLLEAIKVEVKGLGVFPNNHRPRVLWVGVEAPPALGFLAAQIEAAIARLGFAKEERAFAPHLTLARFSAPPSGPSLTSAIEDYKGKTLGTFQALAYFLFESQMMPGKSAVYRKVARFGQADGPSSEEESDNHI